MAASGAAGIVLPSTQALQSNEQMMLLNAVDALRALGVDGIITLPQLVVCGDQSCGKSSVLEAISGIPFPRKTNVCTRFATEVILRRDLSVRMSVSIVPSADYPTQDRERVSGFRRELTSVDDFESLFEEAKRTMGISEQKKNFSKDVLRVEFSGPTQPQLTLVDLPGLFHSETDGQTGDDIKLVDDLVTSYLNNDRSIILAIISARYDANNQAILSRARKVDPEGKRTLGIITKPDTITTDEEERAFLKIARNDDVKFALGWHVVKNMPSGVENVRQESRDEQETEFFNTNPSFSTLPKKKVGIASLRTRLSNVLFDQVKKELPGVIKDIEAKTKITRAAKERLGPARSSLDDQRRFLIQLSESFHSICRDAVAGHYDHDFFRGDVDGERRLCAILMNKHYKFAGNLQKNGASWKIIREDDEHSDINSVTTDESGDFIDDERKRSRKEAIQEACKVLKRNRGRELPGLPNPLLVGELFREYSHPWAGIAQVHIKDVWDTTNLFLDDVLQYLTDDDVRGKIFRHWLNEIMEKSSTLADEKLGELLEVHKDHPLTTNDDFINNRKKIQEKRIHDGVQMDMDLVAAEDAFDNMNAYYKVALNLFMDNVPSLAIQSPIIRKLPSMLSPSAVSNMDDDTIRKIAGESVDKVHEREDTLGRLAKLEEGARICRVHALRPSSIPHLVENSVNVASEHSSVGDRNEKGKGRSKSRRLNSPSVSEDGRATSRVNEQTTNPTSPSWSVNNLTVPGDNLNRRTASASSSLLVDATPTPSILQGAASNSTFASFGNSPATGLFGSSFPHSTASTTERWTGGGLFSIGNVSNATPTSSWQPITSSPLSFADQQPRPIFGVSSPLSNPTSSTTKATLFGNPNPNSGFPAASTSNQGAEALQINDTSNLSHIEQLIQAPKVPTTREHSPRGFQPHPCAQSNLSQDGQIDLFQSIVNSSTLNFSFEELHLADYVVDDINDGL